MATSELMEGENGIDIRIVNEKKEESLRIYTEEVG